MSLHPAILRTGELINPQSGTQGRCLASQWEREHGEYCSCRALAAATGVKPSSIDYAFCRSVLQKRWRINCDHVPHMSRAKVTREPPPHDSRDPLHALLIANANISSD